MKILKKPENVIYDTENPDVMEFNREKLYNLDFLHNLSEKSTQEILSEYFKPYREIYCKNSTPHPIFKDFGKSFFYIINR